MSAPDYDIIVGNKFATRRSIMKKTLTILALLMFATSTLNGCYGKFALTKKIYQVNGEVKDKYLRSALTWAFVIVPVYGVAALADFIAFNTIEFWSGSNPVAAGKKDFQYVDGDRKFDIHAVKSGDTVSYAIKRYEHGRYVDSLLVHWDLSTGNSTAVHQGFATITEYVATKQHDAVHLQIFNKGVVNRNLEHVASYK